MNPVAAIHVAKKQLGLDDDTYRDVLERATGKRSAADLDAAGQTAALDEFRRLGFKSGFGEVRFRGQKKGLEGRFAKKLQALWIAAWNLGLVRDRTDAALLSFVKRQTGIDHTRFLRDAADARKAVEALKAWMEREASVKWRAAGGYDFLALDGGRIAWAQWQKIIPGATLTGNRRSFLARVAQILGRPAENVTAEDWQKVMNALGEEIRRAKP